MEIDKIYNIDQSKGMKQIDNNSIDLISTDPPFGINYQSNFKKDKFDKIKNDDNLDWFQDFANESYRVLKDDSALYCFTRADVYPQMYNAFIKSGFKFKNLIIVPTNSKCGDLQASFVTRFELIMYFNKGRKKFENTKLKETSESYRNDKRFNAPPYVNRLPAYWDWCKAIEHNSKLVHPTQKSIDVYNSMIQISSKENDIVLDPFIGSGTTSIACINTNRRFIGFELDTGYFNIANERIVAVKKTTS